VLQLGERLFHKAKLFSSFKDGAQVQQTGVHGFAPKSR